MNLVPASLRQSRAVTAFVPGTSLPGDAMTCPDIDLHHSRRKGPRTLSHKDATPSPGWPKETKR